MANHKSAKKRSIQNKTKNAVNSKYLSKFRSSLNSFDRAVKSNNVEEIQKNHIKKFEIDFPECLVSIY